MAGDDEPVRGGIPWGWLFALMILLGFGIYYVDTTVGTVTSVCGSVLFGLYVLLRGGQLAKEQEHKAAADAIAKAMKEQGIRQERGETIREKETIREIVRIRCKYCGALADITELRCPSCNAAL